MTMQSSFLIRYRCAAALLLLACLAAEVRADAPALKVSGFLSVVGGKVFGRNADRYEGPSLIAGHPCPCYVSDWGNAGVYEEKVSLKPESRAGLQVKYTVSEQVSAVAQLVLRGADPQPRVQWAYASYAPSNSLEVQAGRKRIPLYYYSDVQDIGAAYPWVGVPPELYGWEATNYNGASLRYRVELGKTALSASLFGGRETLGSSLYQKLYYEGTTKVQWDRLRGADVELVRGPLTMRAVYMQADVSSQNAAVEIDEGARLKAYGLAAKLEFEHWLVLSEVTRLTRDFNAGFRASAPAFTVGVGYRYGQWTPFLNVARYLDHTNAPEMYESQSIKRTSLTLRYDIDLGSSLKAQVDRHTDLTRNFGGDVHVVRLAYDRLF